MKVNRLRDALGVAFDEIDVEVARHDARLVKRQLQFVKARVGKLDELALRPRDVAAQVRMESLARGMPIGPAGVGEVIGHGLQPVSLEKQRVARIDVLHARAVHRGQSGVWIALR